MLRIFCAVFLFLTGLSATARTFWVVAYNVENLFDADGVALYEDYQPDNKEMPSPYNPRKLLTKIQNITRVLASFNNGVGPEVILFQEFELDRTPETTVEYAAFLEQYKDMTVEALLTENFNDDIAGAPVEAFVLKYFEDNGLTGYHIALPEPFTPFEDSPAHTNVVFTKFPINYQQSHPTQNARMIQEVGLDIDGAELIVFNNHWKSGASDPNTEKMRVGNARDLRTAVEAVILRNPQADILIGGDLNTYYNAAQYFPQTDGDHWSRVHDYAIEVLGSQGNEAAVQRGDRMLYNLWFELPPDARASELFRGNWGTLMQMLVTPGLYDDKGVDYVDNSFRVVALPGVNASGPWSQPVSWRFTSEAGYGFSDHFPVAACFTTEHDDSPFKPTSTEAAGPASVPGIDYSAVSVSTVYEFAGLVNNEDATLAANMGEVFAVNGELIYRHPFIVRVGERYYEIYAYDDAIRDQLGSLSVNEPIRFIGQLDEHRGKPQFVLHDASWLAVK